MDSQTVCLWPLMVANQPISMVLVSEFRCCKLVGWEYATLLLGLPLYNISPTHMHAHTNTHAMYTDAPSVLVGPSDTTVLSNVTLSLVCDLDGAPFPEVTWTKDGEIFNYTERIYTRMYSGSLQFDSLQLSDSGVYQCFAANMDDSVESNNATVLVLGGSLFEYQLLSGRGFVLGCAVLNIH